jgi:O-antigen/teichoic acid export membrane protein
MAVRRALLFSTADRYFALAVNFLSVAVVSRTLTPREIGVSVIGMAIIATALSVREFASTNYLIQRPDLTRREIRAAVTLMAVMTMAIAFGLVATAPMLADAYHEANLIAYLRVVSVCLLIDMIWVTPAALMRRDLAFGQVAAVNMISLSIGTVMTITLALNGFSYMSFAWGWFSCSVSATAVALYLRPHFWMFKPTFRDWHAMARFGGYQGATVILAKAYETVPYLLLGRLISPHAAGLFSNSLLICQIPGKLVFGGVMAVVLPAFSAEARRGTGLKRPYLHAMEMVTGIHWPALVVLTIVAYPVVDVVLGDQWQVVAPLVRIIALSSLFGFSFEMSYPVMIALGAVRQLFLRTLIAFPISLAVIAAAIALGGVEAAAWSMLVVVPFQALVALIFVRQHLDIQWIEIAASLKKSAVVAAMSALGPLAVTSVEGFDLHHSVVQAIVAGALAFVGWSIAILLTRHPLLEEVKIALAACRQIMPRRGGWAAATTDD